MNSSKVANSLLVAVANVALASVAFALFIFPRFTAAGVLLVLSLVVLRYVDESRLSDRWTAMREDSFPGAGRQRKAAFLYGGGVDYEITRHFRLCVEYRGFVYGRTSLRSETVGPYCVGRKKPTRFI